MTEPAPRATIVVVDDSEAILKVLARLLRSAHYKVVVTTNPREALGLVHRAKADILITDVEMPGLSGLELTAQARDQFPDVVRILLTGNASVDVAVQAINRGEVFKFVTKPWVREELLEIVREAEVRRAANREVGVPSVAERRKQILAALELEHPGITEVARDGAVYRIGADRLARIRRRARALATFLVPTE